MNGRLKFCISALLILGSFISHGPAFSDIERADSSPVLDDLQTRLENEFNKYLHISTSPKSMVLVQTDHRNTATPGWLMGEWYVHPPNQFQDRWPHRARTYEIMSAEGTVLAHMIYGIALFTKDISPSVTQDAFKAGVQGFHYSTQQISEWANLVLRKEFVSYDQEESVFLDKLVSDGVLTKSTAGFSTTGVITHVLGAAPGKKRDFALNLNHERLHVMWDEDAQFRQRSIEKWQSLSEAEKEAAYQGLKGYDRSNEDEIIEEWAVRENENTSTWLAHERR